MRRLLSLLGVWAVLATTLLAGATTASASAKPIAACVGPDTVLLAVDFAHWGGPIVRACGSTPTTGYKLLNEGSFHTVGTQHDGPAFICRIATTAYHGDTEYPRPSEAGESCGPTPPASGYWSYWHADAGQNTWSYSQLGAMSYQPKSGSVDLWSFGATNLAGTSGSGVPRFSPDDVRVTLTSAPSKATSTSTSTHRSSANAPKTSQRSAARTSMSGGAPSTTSRASTSPPTSSRPTSAHPTSSHPTSASAGSRSPSSTRPVSAGPSDRAITPTAAPPAASTAACAPARTTTPGATSCPPVGLPSGAPALVDAQPVAAKTKPAGSPVPLIIGLVVAALLAGGAGSAVLRRRRSD